MPISVCCAACPSLFTLLLVDILTCCLRLIAGTYNNLLEMASQAPSRLVEQTWEAIRACPGAAQLRNSASSSVQSSISPGPDPTNVGLSDLEKYLAIFLGTLEYSLFPHTRRPIFASPSSINNRDVARNWAVTQIKNNVMGENWMHSQGLAKIADILARTFTMMGICRFPPLQYEGGGVTSGA